MKIFLICAAIVLNFLFVNSQTLFIDDFNYPERDSLEGIGGWYQSGLNSAYNVKVATPGLTYSGYPGSGIGNTVLITNNPNGDIVLHGFTTQTSGNLYMAFMVRVDSLSQTATQGYNIGFDQAGGSTNLNTRFYIQKVSSTTYKMGVNKNASTTYTSANYNTNTTYLVVLKYSFIAGVNNDTSKMFVFSSGVPSAEPVTPDAFATTGADLTDQGEVFLSNLYAQGAPSLINSPVRIDGIRIGTTWAGAVLTNIIQTSTSIPNGFYLGQNYPNPFNPNTNIYFSIPVSSNVKITVRDITGKEISSLVNEYLNAGTYKFDFAGENISSGTYFYMMQAGEFTNVKKMVLVK